MLWSYLIKSGVAALILIGACIGTSVFYKGIPAIRFIVIHLWFVLGVEVVSTIMSFAEMTNTSLFHFYVVEEFVMLSLYYYHWLPKNLFRSFIPWIMLAFVLFSVVNSFVWQASVTFNSTARSLEGLIIVTYALAGLRSILLSEKSDYLRDPHFWINAGLLIYFSTCFLLFIMSNVLMGRLDMHTNIMIWNAHTVLCYLLYSFFAKAFWQIRIT